MKTFLKKILVLIAIILSTTIVTNLSGAEPTAHAANYSCRNFLGMTSWDCNLSDDWQGSDNLTSNVWVIVTNISNDIIVIAAYLILGYVIYGGYLYMLSAGNTSKTADGKKTLTNAFVGLAIVMLAKIIVSTIHIALLGSTGAFSGSCASASDGINCLGEGSANTLVTNLIQWTIGIAGIVAVVFIVVGAIGYITSSGDTGKLQKAKNTILYALIGLAIVGLAEVITAFVSSTIRNASTDTTPAPSTTSRNDSTLIIAKELTHEKQIH